MSFQRLNIWVQSIYLIVKVFLERSFVGGKAIAKKYDYVYWCACLRSLKVFFVCFNIWWMCTAYSCVVCPVASQQGVKESEKRGCASRQCYSLQGVLINESHLSNLRLELCCCVLTTLQSTSQLCASLLHWHNMGTGDGCCSCYLRVGTFALWVWLETVGQIK